MAHNSIAGGLINLTQRLQALHANISQHLEA
jgi:hypothetical protein